MPHINELPEIILQQVFIHAFGEDLENTKKWRFILPLLAVCSQWRNVGKSLVYRTAYIAENLKVKVEPCSQKIPACYFSPVLAVNTENIHLVRHLNITFTTIDAIAMLADQIDELLGGQDKSILWAGVRQLTVKANIMCNGNDFGTYFTDPNDMERQIYRLAQLLVEKLPNVTDIDFFSARCQPAAWLGNLLVAAYENQCKTISSDKDLFTRVDSVTSIQLTKLKTSLTENTNKLLFSNATNTLTTLILKNLPPNFNWSAFSAFKNTNVLVFHCLQTMKLEFSTRFTAGNLGERNYIFQQGVNPVNPIQVLFPLLDELCLILPNIESVQNVLCYNTYQWPNVTKLNLFGLDGSEMFVDFDNDIILRNFDIMHSSIVNNMPHLVALKIDGYMPSILSSMMTDRLYNHYAKQIICISNFHLTKNLDLRQATCLEYLFINLNFESSIALAATCSNTLKVLRFENTPHGFTWSSLIEHDSQCQFLSFTRLERLHIFYNDQTVEFGTDCANFVKFQNNQPGVYAVDCPRLCELNLIGCSYSGIQSIICPGDKEWSMLQNLEIELHIDTTQKSFDISLFKNMNHTMEVFSSHIVKKMPNVNSLSLYDCASSSEVALFSTLIKAYAHQLKHMYSNVPQCLCTFSKAQQLKTLNLNLKNSQEISTVCSRSLELIKLINVTSTFSWDIFSSKNEQGNIQLDNLKTLVFVEDKSIVNSVSTKDTFDSSASVDIYLPRINYISISMNSRNIGPVAAKLHFFNIGNVNLNGQVSSLPLLGESANCQIGYLNIDQLSASNADMDYFYEFTNSWLRYNANNADYRLSLEDVMFDLDYNRIMWTGLSKLIIKCNIKLENVVNIISNLPNLTNLTLEIVSTKIIKAIQGNQSNSIEKIQNISRLKRLSIYSASAESTQENVISGIVQLIFLNTSLTHVALGKQLKSDVKSMLQKHKSAATHVGNIQFSEYYLMNTIII